MSVCTSRVRTARTHLQHAFRKLHSLVRHARLSATVAAVTDGGPVTSVQSPLLPSASPPRAAPLSGTKPGSPVRHTLSTSYSTAASAAATSRSVLSLFRLSSAGTPPALPPPSRSPTAADRTRHCEEVRGKIRAAFTREERLLASVCMCVCVSVCLCLCVSVLRVCACV